ncbi:MAG: hypothetical protein ACK56I_27545, partial [bacterium]
ASTTSAPVPPYDDAAASTPPAETQTLRRSERNRHPPNRLTAAYLQAPQGRVPALGSAVYATFPFPAQPIVLTFPPILPDIGPDPVTYREAISSPDFDQWQTAIQKEYDALMQRKTWEL